MNARILLVVPAVAVFTLPSLFLAAAAPGQEPTSRPTRALDADAGAAAAKRQRLKDPAADFWIYDDFDLGYATARKTGKPLLVSFRCVP